MDAELLHSKCIIIINCPGACRRELGQSPCPARIMQRCGHAGYRTLGRSKASSRADGPLQQLAAGNVLRRNRYVCLPEPFVAPPRSEHGHSYLDRCSHHRKEAVQLTPLTSHGHPCLLSSKEGGILSSYSFPLPFIFSFVRMSAPLFSPLPVSPPMLTSPRIHDPTCP